MATALLLAESVLENFQSLDDDFTRSTDAVVSRLDAVGRGEELGMLDLPHLDAMSRRAQERLLHESVAREIHSNLGAIEQTLDAFFRDPSRQSTLAALKQPIRQIQGALLVLGQNRANAVLTECALAIERFAEPGFTAHAGDFEDVAKKLSALGFFVAQLQGGDADIDALLEPPPIPKAERQEIDVVDSSAPGEAATPDSASTESVAEAEQEAEEIAEDSLADFEVEGLELPPEAAPAAPPPPIETPAPSAEASRLVDASEEDLDAELLSIFLEEANEVLATINAHLPLIHATPGDQASLVTLRRSFHTLKGSGRMVGLADLGEVAWAVEQVMNGWLHEVRDATPALLEMLDLAAETFMDWVRQLESGGSTQFDAAELIHRCEHLGGAEDAEAEAAVEPAPSFVAAAPEVETPEVETPEVETPEVETPEVETPEVETPEVETPEVETPEVETPEVETPEVETPEVETPEVEMAEQSIADSLPSADVVSFPAPPAIRVGEVEVAPALYHLYIEETRGHVAALQADLGLEAVPGDEVIRAAHTTASISAAAGFSPISKLARALEDALVRFSLVDACPTDAQRFVFARCAGALEGMIGAVAERRMPRDEADLAAELNAMKPAEVAAEFAAEPLAEIEAESIEDTAMPLDEVAADAGRCRK